MAGLNQMYLLLYSAALFIAILFASPYFIFQALAHKKYLGSLKARLGSPPTLAATENPRLLIHCVSVGEFLAAEPLIEKLHSQLPNFRLVISTTTATGQELVQQRAAKFADVCYFPLDFSFAVTPFLNAINPLGIIVLETELWPNFLAVAAKKQIPVIIANGRISDRSFQRYSMVRSLLRPVLANVTRFLMQSEQDATRISALGASTEKVLISGNIKYDLGTATQTTRLENVANTLEQMLHLSQHQPLIVAGSTTPEEEEMILSAYQQLLNDSALQTTTLLLAPRRPERFNEVAQLLSSAAIPFIRRSELASDNADNNPANNNQLKSNNGIRDQAGEMESLVKERNGAKGRIILLDSIGELAAVYRFAELVFVGGSLVPKGGHNILEPALYGKAIITGPYMNNFRKIADDFCAGGAMIKLAEKSKEALVADLAQEFSRLLTNGAARKSLGEAAYGVIVANRGALDEHCRQIKELLSHYERR